MCLPPALSPDRLNDCSGHRMGWSAQRTVKARDHLANFVGVRTMEELVQPFIMLRKACACFEVFNEEADEVFISRDENALYTIETSTTWSRRESLNLEQGLHSKVIAVLKDFWRDFLENICNGELSS